MSISAIRIMFSGFSLGGERCDGLRKFSNRDGVGAVCHATKAGVIKGAILGATNDSAKPRSFKLEWRFAEDSRRSNVYGTTVATVPSWPTPARRDRRQPDPLKTPGIAARMSV